MWGIFCKVSQFMFYWRKKVIQVWGWVTNGRSLLLDERFRSETGKILFRGSSPAPNYRQNICVILNEVQDGAGRKSSPHLPKVALSRKALASACGCVDYEMWRCLCVSEIWGCCTSKHYHNPHTQTPVPLKQTPCFKRTNTRHGAGLSVISAETSHREQMYI